MDLAEVLGQSEYRTALGEACLASLLTSVSAATHCLLGATSQDVPASAAQGQLFCLMWCCLYLRSRTWEPWVLPAYWLLAHRLPLQPAAEDAVGLQISLALESTEILADVDQS